MHLLQAVVAGLVILILVLGFFAFHVWMRLYVWPETYRKKEKEGELQEGGGAPGIKEATAKVRKKSIPPTKN